MSTSCATCWAEAVPAAILFDFFGTLAAYDANRTAQRYPATHALARQLGFGGGHDEFSHQWDRATSELEVDQRTTLREFSMTDAAVAFASTVGLEVGTVDAHRLGDSYVDEWQRHVQPVERLAEVIRLAARHARLAVVSNTHHSEMVPRLLERFGIAAHFDAVVLSVNHGFCKPHASIYATTLAALGCRAEDAWFVGDSYLPDWLAPEELGLRGLLIGSADEHRVPEAARLSCLADLMDRLEL